MSDVTIDCIDSFDDPRLQAWDTLLAARPMSVFSTPGYLRTWWETQGRGRLILLLVRRAGAAVAIAPLFAEAGMAFFVGSGGSDHLDFIGDVSDAAVLPAVLGTLGSEIEGFCGAVFYHVPAGSPTSEALRRGAEALGMAIHEQGSMPAPVLDIAADRAAAVEATQKRSLLAAEKYFTRAGALDVHHLRDPAEVRRELPLFFQQHVDRWADTPYPSLFLDEAQRRFYVRMAELGCAAGWLRFTRIDWVGRPIAYHFGFSHAGRYVYYKPTFDVELARHSPGQVLLRHVLREAIDEGASVFDFGIGDEGYKMRFATRVESVHNWGVYPGDASGGGAA